MKKIIESLQRRGNRRKEEEGRKEGMNEKEMSERKEQKIQQREQGDETRHVEKV